MNAMREIIYVERTKVTVDHKSVLTERRCHGLLGKDGSFRLLGCCGKRFPVQTGTPAAAQAQENQNRAA